MNPESISLTIVRQTEQTEEVVIELPYYGEYKGSYFRVLEPERMTIVEDDEFESGIAHVNLNHHSFLIIRGGAINKEQFDAAYRLVINKLLKLQNLVA
jgi:hypothetical protein